MAMKTGPNVRYEAGIPYFGVGGRLASAKAALLGRGGAAATAATGASEAGLMSQIPRWMKYLGGAFLAKETLLPPVMAILNQRSQSRLMEGELELGKKRLESEAEVSKRINEENQRSTDKYLAMLAQVNSKESTERSEDRQMQMMMALIANQQNMRQATTQAAQAGRPDYPMSMSVLMRGI
jgi:hypothetical protein